MIGKGFVATRVVALHPSRSERIEAIRSELEAEERILGFPPFAYVGRDEVGNWELAIGSEHGISLGLSLRNRFVEDDYVWVERTDDNRWVIVEVEEGLPIMEIENAVRRDFARVRISAADKPLFVASSQVEEASKMFAGIATFAEVKQLETTLVDKMHPFGELIPASLVTQKLVDWMRIGVLVGALTATLALAVGAYWGLVVAQREETTFQPVTNLGVAQYHRTELARLLEAPSVTSSLQLIWHVILTIPARAPGWRVADINLEDDRLTINFRPDPNFAKPQFISDALAEFAASEGLTPDRQNVDEGHAYIELVNLHSQLDKSKGINIRDMSAEQLSQTLSQLAQDLALVPDSLVEQSQTDNIVYKSGQWEMPMRQGPVLWLEAAIGKFAALPDLQMQRIYLELDGFQILEGSLSMSHVLRRAIADIPDDTT